MPSWAPTWSASAGAPRSAWGCPCAPATCMPSPARGAGLPWCTCAKACTRCWSRCVSARPRSMCWATSLRWKTSASSIATCAALASAGCARCRAARTSMTSCAWPRPTSTSCCTPRRALPLRTWRGACRSPRSSSRDSTSSTASAGSTRPSGRCSAPPLMTRQTTPLPQQPLRPSLKRIQAPRLPSESASTATRLSLRLRSRATASRCARSLAR